MKKIALTTFRQNLFQIVDQVIETGVPVEIERKGRCVRVMVEERKSKLANLIAHKSIVGDPETLVELEVGESKRNRR